MQTLYENGTVLTMDERHPIAQALLVQDGRIAVVGDRDEALLEVHADCERVDLAGGCLLPAFIDAHSHLTACATRYLQADLSGCTSFDALTARIRNFIAENHVPAGQWVQAAGYDHTAMREGRHPDRAVLDRAAPEHPLLCAHISGHVGAVNTAGLAALGITAETEPPEGGKIDFETGYLAEAALVQYQQRIPMPGLDALLAAYDRAQALYASYGIATAQEGMMPPALAPLYRALIDRRALRLDVVGYADFAEADAVREALPDAVGKYSGRFRLGGYKIFLDGSPQARTAWLRAPYVGTEDCGMGTMRDAQVREALLRAKADGMQLLAHCNGDAACCQYLDACAAVGGVNGLRPVMIHAQLLPPEFLPEVMAYGMIPSFFVGHVKYWGDVHLQNLGPERAAQISPAGSALKLGLPFTFHQDAPVIQPNMLETVSIAATRRTAAGRILGPVEAVPTAAGLRAVTANAAYQYFEEDEKGTLTPGKRADLVWIDRCPLDVPPEELTDLRIQRTVKDGTIIFEL